MIEKPQTRFNSNNSFVVFKIDAMFSIMTHILMFSYITNKKNNNLH